ncbi:MAG: carboxypeptidase-like regulatory domain-containing protein [Acidimicrobiia bacterium]
MSGNHASNRGPVAGISRRDLLKRSAALGGTALWVTPAVQAIGMSRALAQETSPLPPTGAGVVSGQVVDATTGLSIAGATVAVIGTGISTVSDSGGNYTLTNVPAGTQTLEGSASGYFTATTSVAVIDGATVNKVIALSPITTSDITAVLSWGAVPADLDLHASGPDGSGGRFHAAYFDKTPVGHVELDVDDTSSFGPETMSFKIHPVDGTFVAGTYRVWVHDYTNRTSGSIPQWDDSAASVLLNGLSGQIAEYLVDAAVAAKGGVIVDEDKLWRVVQFDLDTAGTVSNIVVFQNFVNGTESTTDV